MRVVLDTNVLVSTLLWRKHLAPFFNIINAKQITLCFSPDTLDELNRVLNYPKIRAQAEKTGLDVNSIINQLVAGSAVIQPSVSLELPALREDPSDRIFLACAAAAKAACIITGDKVLLKFKVFQGIPIVTPRQFIEISDI